MILGPRGEAIIKGKETLRLMAYKPTPKDVWTIGWGHTKSVIEGMKITQEQAQKFFLDDTAEAVAAVNAIGVPLSQSMFDATVSLVFNAGAGAVAWNKTIGTALRSRHYFEAWAGFALYRKQAGIDMRGLAIRRSLEMALFMEDPLPG